MCGCSNVIMTQHPPSIYIRFLPVLVPDINADVPFYSQIGAGSILASDGLKDIWQKGFLLSVTSQLRKPSLLTYISSPLASCLSADYGVGVVPARLTVLILLEVLPSEGPLSLATV